MQFTKCDSNAPPNMEPVKKKRRLHPDANNYVNFGQLPNSRLDKINYKQYGSATDEEKQQLAKDGKCFI